MCNKKRVQELAFGGLLLIQFQKATLIARIELFFFGGAKVLTFFT